MSEETRDEPRSGEPAPKSGVVASAWDFLDALTFALSLPGRSTVEQIADFVDKNVPAYTGASRISLFLADSERSLQLIRGFGLGEHAQIVGFPDSGTTPIAPVIEPSHDPALEVVDLLDPGSSLMVHARDSGSPIFVSDVEAFRRECGLQAPSGSSSSPNAGKNCVLIPLTYRGDIFGMLNLTGLPDDRFRDDAVGHDFRRSLEVTASWLAQAIAAAVEVARLKQRVTRDPLTGLFNREAMFEIIASEIHRTERYGQKLSILMLDIDRFKRVNDEGGHLLGDSVLAEVARRIRSVLRTVDVAGRFAGDEFVVLLPQTDDTGARRVAERIRSAIEEMPFDASGRKITISIGAAERVEGLKPKEFLGRADESLYAAKRDGRNRVVLFQDLQTG